MAIDVKLSKVLVHQVVVGFVCSKPEQEAKTMDSIRDIKGSHQLANHLEAESLRGTLGNTCKDIA